MDNRHLNDPFEAELASFDPQSVSSDLRERIRAELWQRRSTRWVAVLAGLAAAACMAMGFLIWQSKLVVRVDPVHPPIHLALIPTAAELSPPTLMDYQRAFAQSSEAFDALLSQPAGGETRSTTAPDRQAEPVRAFTLSSINLITANGDWP